VSQDSQLGAQLGFPLGFTATVPLTPITESVSDSYTLSDSVAIFIGLALAVSVSDTVTLSDSIEFFINAVPGIGRNSRLGAQSQLGFPLGGASSGGASSPISLSVSDTLTLSDSIVANPNDQSRKNFGLSDTITLSDSVSVNLIHPLTESVSDTITVLTDSVAFFIGGVSNESVSDTITLSDSVSIFNGLYTVLIGDTLSLSDSITILEFSTGPATAGVTQVLVEVAPHYGQGFTPPNIIDTQDVIEYLFLPTDTIYDTQQLIEYLFHPPDHIIATQILIEVAHKPYPIGPVRAHYKRFYPIKK
jgi:hypothetical protein